MFKKYITNFDIYGTNLDFTLFNSREYKTHIGGFFTLTTLALFFLCFYYFGGDFYNRTNPHYLNQKITLKDYPLYNLNSDDLFLAIRLEDYNGNYFNSSGYVDINYTFYNLLADSSGNLQSTSNPVEFINCSLINLTRMRMTLKKDVSQMSCIKFDNSKLGGFWDASFLNFIKITYSPCINTTENGNSCLDPNLAAETLDSQLISFNIYTNVYFSDLADFANPLKSNLYNIYSYVNTQGCKNMKLFYRLANISTDLNYIVKRPNSYSLFGVDNFLVDVLKVNPSFQNATNDTNIALFEIYFSNNVETFDVAYIKLQEILATLGGILSFVSVVLKTIAGFFNIHYRNQEIFNELFDFNDFKNENKLNEMIAEHIKLKRMKTIFKTNSKTPQIKFENSSDRQILEKCEPPFLENKPRHEISNISIENSKNQLYYNQEIKQGKYI